MGTAIKTGLDTAKTISKKLFHKTTKTTGEFIGNKTAEKIVKLGVNSRNVEEINIPPDKREEMLNELRKVL